MPTTYARISFDPGLTLLAWVEEKGPGACQSILEADRESQKKYSGHGSALAQAYNYMILPMAKLFKKFPLAVLQAFKG